MILIIVLLVKNLPIMIILPSLKTSNRIVKFLNLKFPIESGLLSKKIFSAMVTLKIGQDKYQLSILR